MAWEKHSTFSKDDLFGYQDANEILTNQEILASRVVENLTVCNTTADSQIDITADRLGITDAVSTSLNITVSATASGGLNGIDLGSTSEAVDTLYSVWAIASSNSTAVGGLMSVSFTTPTMPAGYSKKRLISMVRNNNSGNFLRFTQSNERYHYSVSPWQKILIAGNSTVWANVDNQKYVRSELCSAIEYLADLQYTSTLISAYVRKKDDNGDGKRVGRAYAHSRASTVNFLSPLSSEKTQYQTSVPTGELTLYLQGAKLKL